MLGKRKDAKKVYVIFEESNFIDVSSGLWSVGAQ